MKDELIKLELTMDEAVAFRFFQQHYNVIAPICGYMESLNLMNITNSQLVLDIDQFGTIKHMSITKHFRT